MKRDDLDLHAVRPEHAEIHDRLWNWARYVSVRPAGPTCTPMFRHYRSSDVWGSAPSTPIDTLDGHALEKRVGQLPEKHRDAIRWHYVFFYIHPGKVQRHLGVTRSGLADLIHDGRSMLKNRTVTGNAALAVVLR